MPATIPLLKSEVCSQLQEEGLDRSLSQAREEWSSPLFAGYCSEKAVPEPISLELMLNHQNTSRILAAFFVVNGAFAHAEQAGPFTYTISNDEVTITNYDDPGEAHALHIPEAIEGDPVTAIGDGAFALSSFTSITIPSSVKRLGAFSFQGCIKYSTLFIPNSLESIGEGAFFENYGLQSLIFEDGGDISLGGSVFVRCLGLVSVRLREGMTEISAGMFANCRELRAIRIPDTVERVGLQALFGCANLASVRLGLGITEIADKMFSNCIRLKSIHLPSTIISIGEEAFASCTSLTSVVIPGSVTTIKSRAFQFCTALDACIFLGDAPSTFENGPPGSPIPSGVFAFHSPGFKIFFLRGNAGFSEPNWMGEPSESLDAVALPPAPWLVSHGLPLSSDFSQTLNEQGVDLFTCYAFNLNPRDPDLSRVSMFRSTSSGGELDYYGASPGVLYETVWSDNLLHWSSSDITTGAPRPDGRVTSTLHSDRAQAFMRVEASRGW